MVESALRDADLPPLAWYDALLELERAGDDGIRPLELRDKLLLPQYALSRLLDRMEKAGLTERLSCPSDKRGHLVRTTGRGRDTRTRMWPVYAKVLNDRIAGNLEPGDRLALAKLLGKIPE
jgi:DNA-binding MarR family transcriptional regulator